MWFLKLYNIVFRIISFVKNVKTELDFTFILSCASASYADSFFSSYTDFLFSLAFWTDFVYNKHWLFCVKALNCKTIRQ